MSTSLIAKPINTMMQKAVAQKMQSRLGDDQEDAVKISEIPAMYASKVSDIPSNIGTQVRNIPQNFSRSVDERVNAVRNLTPQNKPWGVFDLLGNRAVRLASKIHKNPVKVRFTNKNIGNIVFLLIYLSKYLIFRIRELVMLCVFLLP